MGKCNRNMRLHSTLAYAKTLSNLSIAQSVYTTHSKRTATLLGHRVYLAHYYIIKFLVAQLHITRHIIALNITCRLIITIHKRLLHTMYGSITSRNEKIIVEIFYLLKTFTLNP